jgi:SRSO17 transposase
MDIGANSSRRFDLFANRLACAMGHDDRIKPCREYLTGLMLPGRRKSVEPMAARLDPTDVSARHQSLLHFIGQSPWKDKPILREVRKYALPLMQQHGPIEAWIIDDCGLPKKGRHSVGVANQYCGVLGKNHNCQVSVSLSLANEQMSLPVAHRLYLPKAWANDEERRKKVRVPGDIAFATKPQIALDLVKNMSKETPDVPRGVVLADAAYGEVLDFRDGLTELGLRYIVGVKKTLAVWSPGVEFRLPADGGLGRPPTVLRASNDGKPMSALGLAQSLPEDTWANVTWREGSSGGMTSRFAAVRIRPRPRKRQTEIQPEEWLLIEWPKNAAEPTKYWLSTEDAELPLVDLVRRAKLRWRIERDYQELKQEVGFGHYEGRGWRGFHHHTTLCIAAYAFLQAERARLSPPGVEDKPPVQVPPLPKGFRPRGSPSAR